MWERVQTLLVEALGRLGAALASDLPGVVAMLLVLLVTLLLASVARAVLRRALTRLGIDRRAREWGLTSGQPVEPRHEPSWLFARGVFWLVMLGGVALALDVLGASTTTAVGHSLLAYLPRLVIGALVLLVGVGAARFLERGVLIGAVNLGLRQARQLSLAVKWFLLALAAAMALEHLGVGGVLPSLAFGLLLGGCVLAGALAVGLGARDAVARALDRRLRAGGPARGDEPRGGGRRVQHL
jgi:hypothetical protein